MITCLPSQQEYIVLLHDILNNIKKRKISVLSQIIERDIDENLINNINTLSLNASKINVNLKNEFYNKKNSTEKNNYFNDNSTKNKNIVRIENQDNSDKENNINLSNLIVKDADQNR